ncbi:protein MFI [Pimephales promelas]|nr:protein MFI [Pimephales promelas]
MEGRLEKYENCARRIQSYWRSFRDRRLFRLLIYTLRSAEQCPASSVLLQLSPREAELLKDPCLKCKLRFRFAGPRFPPSVVFKIVHMGGGRQHLCGHNLFTLFNQATADSCRMMGNRVFMDLISVNEIHKAAVEPQDVMCMRDYMQYSSHLDELPARLGGRENGWRFMTLKVLSRDVPLRRRESGFSAGGLRAVLPSRPGCAGQELSHRGFLASTRRSARAQITADRKRRLYGLTDTHRVRYDFCI